MRCSYAYNIRYFLERNKNNNSTKKSKVGKPPKDAKLVLSGIFYIISSGAQWRLLPDYYGKTSTVHGKFRQ
jgi:transposase